jgi:glyoxylase-like metal-dependent hydrolase (beta-lactamase superfamily II)
LSSEVHRYKVGDIAITVLFDGVRFLPSLDGYVLNAGLGEVVAAFAAGGLPTDHIRSEYNVALVETAGRRVLIDTGIGEARFEPTKGERGRFLRNLGAAGIDRRTIDTVAISHFHPDHVNGLLAADDTPAFPNARIMVPEPEWNFWMDDGEMGTATGHTADLFRNSRRVFDALDRNVTCFTWGQEIAPGVTAVDTSGHTAGHTSFMVSSGPAKVFIQGDLNNQSVVFSKYPEWHSKYDADPALGGATRRRIYEMLLAENIPVQAYHHPFPGLGRVERDGAGFRVVPIA